MVLVVGGGVLMSEKVMHITEDRTRMEVRLDKECGQSGGGLFFIHSCLCGLSAVWPVEHLRHTGQ